MSASLPVCTVELQPNQQGKKKWHVVIWFCLCLVLFYLNLDQVFKYFTKPLKIFWLAKKPEASKNVLIKKVNPNVHLGKLTFVGKKKGTKTKRIYLNFLALISLALK